MDKSTVLPFLIAVGVIVATGLVIYVFILPLLCRVFTSATLVC